MTLQTHENLDITNDDLEHEVPTDPKIAEISQRFNVSPATAEVLSVLDDGGIHAGGGAPDKWREHSFAGVTAGTEAAWATARDKGGAGRNYDALSLFSQQLGRKSEGMLFSSDDPKMKELERAGLTIEEARNFVVYALTRGSMVMPMGDTEILRPMEPHEKNPSILLAKGAYVTPYDSATKMLEVTTTLNSEGQAIGFSAASRPWNDDTDGSI